MNQRLGTYILAIAILIFAQAQAWAVNNSSTNFPVFQEDVILQWNRVLMETILTPGQQPATIIPMRSYAILHAAMYDAVNSIDGTHTPYLTDVPGSQNASIEAAAAQAAHDVLVALFPTRVAIFDAELATSLQGIEENRAQQGIRVGQIVAERLMAVRSNDGWNVTPPAYSLPATPGNWQPTPPTNTPAAFTHYPSVLPFAITSATQFAPNPPPALTSEQYAADLNEVKEIGSAASMTRTADQTLVAKLWANVGTPTNSLFVWNNVARTVSVAQNLTTVERARLFALTNIAVHDALQTTFASKFHYGLWRPVTAIRHADEDGNAATSPDPAWSPLIPTPPYPSYAGNMAAIGTSQATILALFFGRDDITFNHTWVGAGGATRSYAGFGAMADEEAAARIYGGIHFRFDQLAGQSAGTNVANYVFSKIMRPRQCVK